MIKKLLAVTIASSLSFGVMAAPLPSFNFVEIGFTELDIDGQPSKPDGFEFDFNYELTKNYYLSADYAKAKAGGDSLSTKSIGLGYKVKMSKRSVIFSEIDWVELRDNSGNSENGYSLAMGIRSNLTKKFELSGAFEYENVDSNSANYFTVGAAYKLTKQFAIYSDYKMESDVDQLSLGMRFEF